MKKNLTLARRQRIAEILKTLGDGVGINVKAEKVANCLGEPCTHGEALSLLSQFREGKPRRKRKTWAERNQERFEKMKAQRKDVY